jgi:hypothetical protein
LKAKFKKHNDCGCEQSSCAPAQHTCCNAAPVSSGCGCEERESKWAKLKGKFKKHGGDCGCESSANSCGCGGGSGYIGGGVIGAPAERIPASPAPGAAPQAMPKPMGSVMGNGVIVTPVVAPRLSSDQPF